MQSFASLDIVGAVVIHTKTITELLCPYGIPHATGLLKRHQPIYKTTPHPKCILTQYLEGP